MDLSIVIVNYRGWSDLAVCLDSLAYLSKSDSPSSEIIVVDNASGDGRLPEFRERHAGVRFVENDGNHGFAHACNLGAGQAAGDTLLFLNPDARDPGGEVARFWNALQEHPDTAIASVRQVDGGGRPQKVFDAFPSAWNVLGPMRALMRLVDREHHADARRCRDPWRAVDWVSGSALMIRRADFTALGGWCDDYWMYGEDVDLCRRARDAGLAVACCGEVVLEHRHGGTSRRNVAAAALTRSEVIISRHLYASRNLGRGHAIAFHGLLLLGRLPPLLLGALLARLWPNPPDAVAIRAGTLKELARHYRRGMSSGDWRSPRVVARETRTPT